MLDEVGSNALKVVTGRRQYFFTPANCRRCAKVLPKAFELLGKDIVLAHAKDLDHDGEAGHRAAGEGLLDYEFYMAEFEARRISTGRSCCMAWERRFLGVLSLLKKQT